MPRRRSRSRPDHGSERSPTATVAGAPATPAPSGAPAGPGVNGAPRRAPRIALATLLVVLATLLAVSQTPSLVASDEVDYVLLVRSLVEHGRLDVVTPFDELPAPAWMIGNLHMSGHGSGARLVSQYPPLYAVLVAPAYATLGMAGLFWLNAAAFVVTTGLVAGMGRRLTSSPWLGVAGAVAFSCATYSATHALRLWPHALSVALVVAAAYPILSAEPASRRSLFLAGCAVGAAVGVRYTNGALLLVLAGALVSWPRDRLASFLAGAAIPGAALLALNARLHDDPLMTGYGPIVDPAGAVPLLAVAATLAALGWLGRRRLSTLRVDPRAAWLAGLALVLVSLLVPRIAMAARVMWAEVVDLRAFPGALVGSIYKKALLQSCPFLAMAVFGVLLGRRQGLAMRPLVLAAVLPAVHVAVYAAYRFHGGPTDALNMRYLLEALPFLVLLCLPVARALFTTPRTAAIGLGAVVVAALAMAPWTVEDGQLFPYTWTFTTLPIALAGTLVALGLAWIRTRGRRLGIALAATWVVATAYSVVASAADAQATRVTLRVGRAVTDELRRQARPGALIVVCGKPRMVNVAPLILEGFRVADACLDQGASLPLILDMHTAYDVPVHFLDGGDVVGWQQAIERVRRLRPPDGASWIRFAAPETIRTGPQRRLVPRS